MATTINRFIDFADYPLTSQLGTITALTTHERIDAVLSAGNSVIFSTNLYAFEGAVTLYDVSSIIEEYMRKMGQSVGRFTLQIGEDSVLIRPVYCDFMAPGLSVKDSFLSTLQTQRAYSDSFFELNTIPNDQPTEIRCLYRLPDGSVNMASFPSDAPSFSAGCARGSFAMIWQMLLESAPESVSLLAVVIVNGSRSKTFYMMPGRPDVRFYFRNCFNACDFLDLKGTITEKTSVSREIAVCAHEASQYDRRINQTFEFQSEPLTEQEARSISQLVTSHEVYLSNDGDINDVVRILVTDHTCEVDNDDGALPSVKLTFRYTSSSPCLSKGLVEGMLVEGGIFSKQFTDQFR